jgi:hypothetical protein
MTENSARTGALALALCLALSLAFGACSGEGAGDPSSSAVGASVPTGGGGAGAGGSGGAGGQGGGCVDTCPFAGGVAWECRERFMYGVNYAWQEFAGDFGGISQWGISGVVASESTHAQNLAAMRAAGSSVIRWWIFPDFRGDGVTFDNTETATGVTAGAIADLQKALELADQADVYLMLCIFSFDNFRPSQYNVDIWTPGISAMVRDNVKRQALMDHVVQPLAQTVEASPFRRRMVAWDVINEPEWAMTGASPYGDEDYAPEGSLDPVTHAEMETFVSDTIVALRGSSTALVTVGGAAVKWLHAWSQVDIDFYQFHIYDWVDVWWPYETPAATYGLAKPIVMGELPMDLLGGDPYGTVVASFWSTGYAGALSWMFNGASSQNLANVKAFADQHPCETTYSPYPAQALAPQSAPIDEASARPGYVPSVRVCSVVDGRPVCGSRR